MDSIILFDGVCNLCNGTVAFVIPRDKKKRFRFAALQSPVGQELLRARHLSTTEFDSFVLLEGDRLFLRSTAALWVARHLSGLWPLLYVGIVIPRCLRDRIYNWIARHRYAWFGKKESCMIPTPEVRQRFLETANEPDSTRST